MPIRGIVISPQHHRDIEAEAQYDGQPHPAEGPVVLVFSGAAEEQDDDQQAQQGKGDIAVDAPGEGRIRARATGSVASGTG